ncbi:MAG: hypothetical protein ACR2NH_07415 [Solirubrobacteraceae bacterium]
MNRPEEPALPASLAARVEQIVRAAEREAVTVQRDLESQRRVAEAEANRYLVEAKREADSVAEAGVARLRELSDELVARANAARDGLDELVEAIARATAEIGTAPPLSSAPGAKAQPVAAAAGPSGLSGSEAEPVEEVGGSGEPEVPPPPRPSSPEERRRARSGTPDDGRARHDAARLVAIEMAVAGRSRAEVDGHLREAFRITDTGALLDDVFGAGPRMA